MALHARLEVLYARADDVALRLDQRESQVQELQVRARQQLKRSVTLLAAMAASNGQPGNEGLVGPYCRPPLTELALMVTMDEALHAFQTNQHEPTDEEWRKAAEEDLEIIKELSKGIGEMNDHIRARSLNQIERSRTLLRRSSQANTTPPLPPSEA